MENLYIVAWNESLKTGIGEIDKQHQILFDCLDRLETVVSSEDRWAAVHFALEELDDFTRIHFVVEEALMRLHEYPLIDAHILEHGEFIGKLALVRQQSLRMDVRDPLIELLRSWLVNHIGKTDHQYVPHLRTATIVLN